MHRFLAALVLTLSAIATQPAQAYETKRTESGEPLRWNDRRVELRIRESDDCGPSREELVAAAEIATEAWRGLGGAPDLVIGGGRPPAAPAVDGEHGIYVLCAWPYGDTLAVTVGSHDPADGRMVDADVLVNGEAALALLREREGHEDREHGRTYDLASVLTHELGHVLGLDESDVAGSTMWPRTRRGDTSQRTVETDDEEGLTAVYARSTSASLEASAVAGGCSSVPGPTKGANWCVLVLAVLALRRMRG